MRHAYLGYECFTQHSKKQCRKRSFSQLKSCVQQWLGKDSHLSESQSLWCFSWYLIKMTVNHWYCMMLMVLWLLLPILGATFNFKTEKSFFCLLLKTSRTHVCLVLQQYWPCLVCRLGTSPTTSHSSRDQCFLIRTFWQRQVELQRLGISLPKWSQCWLLEEQ